MRNLVDQNNLNIGYDQKWCKIHVDNFLVNIPHFATEKYCCVKKVRRKKKKGK